MIFRKLFGWVDASNLDGLIECPVCPYVVVVLPDDLSTLIKPYAAGIKVVGPNLNAAKVLKQ